MLVDGVFRSFVWFVWENWNEVGWGYYILRWNWIKFR